MVHLSRRIFLGATGAGVGVAVLHTSPAAAAPFPPESVSGSLRPGESRLLTWLSADYSQRVALQAPTSFSLLWPRRWGATVRFVCTADPRLVEFGSIATVVQGETESRIRVERLSDGAVALEFDRVTAGGRIHVFPAWRAVRSYPLDNFDDALPFEASAQDVDGSGRALTARARGSAAGPAQARGVEVTAAFAGDATGRVPSVVNVTSTGPEATPEGSVIVATADGKTVGALRLVQADVDGDPVAGIETDSSLVAGECVMTNRLPALPAGSVLTLVVEAQLAAADQKSFERRKGQAFFSPPADDRYQRDTGKTSTLDEWVGPSVRPASAMEVSDGA